MKQGAAEVDVSKRTQRTGWAKEFTPRPRSHETLGYGTQKWYFSKGAADGAEGFKENVELVRALREELPDATLMFDNHSIRQASHEAPSHQHLDHRQSTGAKRTEP